VKKRILSVLLVSSIALTSIVTPTLVVADDFDSKIEQKDQEINNLKNQQADAQAQIEALENDVVAINEKAEALLAQQSTLNADSAKLQKEIDDLNVRIEKREEAIQKQARDVQVNGQSTNFIDAVLEADSLTDAIGRVQAMTTIVNANNELVQQQKADQEAVKTKKNENDKKLKEIEENKLELEKQVGTLQSKQADLNVLKADLALQQSSKEDEKADLEKQKESYQAEQARIAAAEEAAKLAREREEAAKTESSTSNTTEANKANTSNESNSSESSTTTGTSNTDNNSETNNSVEKETPKQDTDVDEPKNNTNVPSQSVNGSAIVSEAMKYLGTPYVWGGTTPNGFDCSGFTQYVFAKVGISLPRVTYEQEYSGTVISINEAKAGDLLFWGSRGSTHHVAIALGGGQYIHAPTPGQSVSVSSYSYYSPSFAVRVN
jgi:peptidoglycan hydrolase CwlO-like protein